MRAMQHVGLRKFVPILIGLSFYVIFGIASSSTVSAHGATPKKIEEKIDIAAKPELVWGLISDFAGISRWNPAVTTSKANRTGSRTE